MSFKDTLKAGVAGGINLCQHETFTAHCHVSRLGKIQGGPITGYALDVNVTCAQCGVAFRFNGVPDGVDAKRPGTSLDGTMLHAPMEPATTSNLKH